MAPLFIYFETLYCINEPRCRTVDSRPRGETGYRAPAAFSSDSHAMDSVDPLETCLRFFGLETQSSPVRGTHNPFFPGSTRGGLTQFDRVGPHGAVPTCAGVTVFRTRRAHWRPPSLSDLFTFPQPSAGLPFA